MKKVVDGKLYDTADATTVTYWRETSTLWCGIPVSVRFDLLRRRTLACSAEEALAKMKPTEWGGVSTYDVPKDDGRGEFFVAKYIENNGPGVIVPVTAEQARRLFEEHTDEDWGVEDAYRRFFGDCAHDDQLADLKKAFEKGLAEQRNKDGKQREQIESECDAAKARIKELETKLAELTETPLC